MSRRLTGLLRLFAIGALGGAIGSLAACDSCGGVVGCERDSRLGVAGQIVDRTTGRGVPGTRVEVSPSAGGTSFTPFASTTDAQGLWEASGDAPLGELTVDVAVTPPAPAHPYRVRSLRMTSSTRRGNGAVLGRWVSEPYVQFLGEVRSRITQTTVYAARVEFQQTSGVKATPSTFNVIAGDYGRFTIDLAAEDVGDIVGNLRVTTPTALTPAVFANVTFRVQYRDEPVDIGGVFTVGATLTYTGEIYYRGTGALIANTDVTFTRTGGTVATSPNPYVARIDATGHFLFAPTPSDEGVAVGDLSFVPPGSATRVFIRNVRLTTYDSLETRLLRVGYGQQLLYAGELQLRGTFARASGVPIEFRRTGGIAITPAVIRATSDAAGRFPIAAAVTDTGEVVGDLIIDPDGPRREIYPGIRLRTFESDESRLAQVWTVGDAIFYSGELFDRGTGLRRAGVDARFTRTGGVQITPSTTTGRTDAAGRFLIAASASEPGVVIGDIEVPSAGGFTTTIRGVRLATQRDDSLRLGGVWGFGPSLLYAGEILSAAGDTPVAGAQVSFERTGGIAASPTRIDAVTDASGRFPLHFQTSLPGDVIGTLTIRPPAPWSGDPIVITDVHATTFDGDEQRLLAVWRIPAPR